MTQGKETRRQEQLNTRRLVVLLDIDNTLYNDTTQGGLASQIQAALVEYIEKFLKMSKLEAEAYSRRCYKEYGLTICGLKYEQEGIDPHAVTDFVYERCDFSGLQEDPELRAMLSRLQESHHFFYLTNAAQRHATTVLQRLGLVTDDFRLNGFSYKDQWERTAPKVCNKPMCAAYNAIYEAVREYLPNVKCLLPEQMVMVDDSPCNLIWPAALGWSVVWVSHEATLPDVLIETMKTGRLYHIRHITELENVISRIAIERSLKDNSLTD